MENTLTWLRPGMRVVPTKGVGDLKEKFQRCPKINPEYGKMAISGPQNDSGVWSQGDFYSWNGVL